MNLSWKIAALLVNQVITNIQSLHRKKGGKKSFVFLFNSSCVTKIKIVNIHESWLLRKIKLVKHVFQYAEGVQSDGGVKSTGGNRTR